MKVRYGYPRDGHEVGEVVELPDADARRVIGDGFGQRVDDDTPEGVTEPEPEDTPADPVDDDTNEGER